MEEDIKFEVEKNRGIVKEEIKVSDGSGRDYLLPASILIAAIMISGSIMYLVGNGNKNFQRLDLGQADVPGATVPTVATGDVPQVSDRDVILGNSKAPVTLIEYGDYQCPFCGRFFTQVEPPLRDNYIKNGKVRMVFRNFQFLGPESTAAAGAAECAKDQRQYWAYHDALFTAEIADGRENNGNLTRDLFLKLAGDLKLDVSAFTNCIDSNKYASQVSKDTADAQAHGVNSTPTTFVNDQKLQGALPFAQFASVIDGFLKTK